MKIFKKITNSDNFFIFILLNVFYTIRFIYFAIKNSSVPCLRYYPGYHGSNIPSLKLIKNNETIIFNTSEELQDGIDLNTNDQLSLFKKLVPYFDLYKPSKNKENHNLYFYNNDMYGYYDGLILFSFIHHFKPSRIIEIGSGHSSGLMIDTCKALNATTELTFIDPYSTNILDVIGQSDYTYSELLRTEVQSVDLGLFKSLGRNDILFIDSSHVVKIGSDLSYILSKILPSLEDGVIIHIHDIWFPWEYPKSMIFKGRLYNEAYFIRAFLQFNSKFKIIFFGSHIETIIRQNPLSMPGGFKEFGNSLWLRKTGC